MVHFAWQTSCPWSTGGTRFERVNVSGVKTCKFYYNLSILQKMGRSLDDADMERALRTAPAPDVVRSALPTTRYADSIDQLLAAPQKILIPERYIPEKVSSFIEFRIYT